MGNIIDTPTDSELQTIRELGAKMVIHKFHIENNTFDNETFMQDETTKKFLEMIGKKVEANAKKSCQEFIAESENNIYINKIEK
jgi:hypothetical protein